MEVSKFQSLLINVTSSLTGLKADMKCGNKKCKKRIYAAPAVKGLMACIMLFYSLTLATLKYLYINHGEQSFFY